MKNLQGLTKKVGMQSKDFTLKKRNVVAVIIRKIIRTYTTIKYEVPEEYVETGQQDVGGVVDGKDIQTATFRSSSLLHRLQYSDKVSDSAARGLSYSTKIGLGVEHSCLYGGKASETTIFKQLGSITERIPLEWWGEDVPTVSEQGRPLTTMEEVATLSSDCKRRIRDKKGAIIDKRASAVKGIIGRSNNQENRLEENDAALSAEEAKKPQIQFMAECIQFFKERKTLFDKRPQDASLDPLSEAGITAAQKEALYNHPLRTKESTLEHYETHFKLDRLYASGRLRPCLLSYYLDFFRPNRMRILQHLGSKLLQGDDLTITQPLPELWPRLAKFPPGSDLSGDKGFCKDSGHLPHQNLIHTPIRLDGRVQYSRMEIKHGRRNKKNRYTSETFFSRVTDVAILTDRVPREHMRHLEHAWNWAHGRANIQQPLLYPLNWSAYINRLPK